GPRDDRVHIAGRQCVWSGRSRAGNERKETWTDFTRDAADYLRNKLGIWRHASWSKRDRRTGDACCSCWCWWIRNVREWQPDAVDENVVTANQRRCFKASDS